MNLAKTLFSPAFLLTASSLFGQSFHQNKFDSSFTLTKYIRQDKLDVGQHGIFFYQPKGKPVASRQVLKDLNSIESLTLIDLANYQKEISAERNHLIKIWTSKKTLGSI